MNRSFRFSTSSSSSSLLADLCDRFLPGLVVARTWLVERMSSARGLCLRPVEREGVVALGMFIF